MLSYRFILSAVICFFLSACADAPSVATAHYFHHFNFSKVQSYTFYGRNDENFDYQSLSDVTRNSIELALEKQLDKQGLVYKDFNQADIIVSYFWVSEPEQLVLQHQRRKNSSSNDQRFQKQRKIQKYQQQVVTSHSQLKKYNQGVRYCAACLKMSTEGEKVSQISSDAGALIVDLVSPKTSRSVWRSSYPVIIKEKENSREIQQRIQRAVQQMLLQFPKS